MYNRDDWKNCKQCRCKQMCNTGSLQFSRPFFSQVSTNFLNFAPPVKTTGTRSRFISRSMTKIALQERDNNDCTTKFMPLRCSLRNPLRYPISSTSFFRYQRYSTTILDDFSRVEEEEIERCNCTRVWKRFAGAAKKGKLFSGTQSIDADRSRRQGRPKEQTDDRYPAWSVPRNFSGEPLLKTWKEILQTARTLSIDIDKAKLTPPLPRLRPPPFT